MVGSLDKLPNCFYSLKTSPYFGEDTGAISVSGCLQRKCSSTCLHVESWLPMRTGQEGSGRDRDEEKGVGARLCSLHLELRVYVLALGRPTTFRGGSWVLLSPVRVAASALAHPWF